MCWAAKGRPGDGRGVARPHMGSLVLPRSGPSGHDPDSRVSGAPGRDASTKFGTSTHRKGKHDEQARCLVRDSWSGRWKDAGVLRRRRQGSQGAGWVTVHVASDDGGGDLAKANATCAHMVMPPMGIPMGLVKEGAKAQSRRNGASRVARSSSMTPSPGTSRRKSALMRSMPGAALLAHPRRTRALELRPLRRPRRLRRPPPTPSPHRLLLQAPPSWTSAETPGPPLPPPPPRTWGDPHTPVDRASIVSMGTV